MKKNLLASIAILFAVGLSSFSVSNHAKKSDTLTTYWFYVSDGEPAGTSSSPSVSPLQSCSTVGFGCIDGYESATPLEERPQGDPNGQFKQ